MNRPTLVFHADWSSNPRKRWCAKATLGSDARYSASAPQLVGDLPTLLESLRAEAGEAGIVFAGFDFPIGIPEHYARCSGITEFSGFLAELGAGEWQDFFRVCDDLDEVSLFRPFYPNRGRKGCSRQHLLHGHNASDMKVLLRRCELGGNGQRQACSLFWTLGANQVGKAAIAGWRDILVPALNEKSTRLWSFDGSLETLLMPGNTVIAETYPAEYYGWFARDPLRSKTDAGSRKHFGENLLSWAQNAEVEVEPPLRDAIRNGFSVGRDDAFDAVVGLFGMLQACLGQRTTGEPVIESIRNIEGWILGRKSAGGGNAVDQ